MVEIGGKPARVLYRGRTVFPGFDWTNVVVPEGVGVGCGVSDAVGSGSVVGNFTAIPAAVTGNTCPAEGGDERLLITDAQFYRPVVGPAADRTVPRNTNSVGAIGYALDVGSGTAGNYLNGGSYSFSGPGGSGIGAFAGTFRVPTELVTGGVGVTVPWWTGGEPGGYSNTGLSAVTSASP